MFDKPIGPCSRPSSEASEMAAALRDFDPEGNVTSRTFRETYDQLYDGVNTGRYSWDQLFKTEKTHFGTLIEINLRRSLDGFIEDGDKLDFKILNTEVDCKFSQTKYQWMIPEECVGHMAMVCHSSDEHSKWSVGFVSVNPEILNRGMNRDRKRTIRSECRSAIAWAWEDASLPPNILLQMNAQDRERVLSPRSGQGKINELFRTVLEVRIPRGTIATVAQQKDYMKRIRDNGGARSNLRPEGIIILGDYLFHQYIAKRLGLAAPKDGDSIAVRVTKSENQSGEDSQKLGEVFLQNSWWRKARVGDLITSAPRFSKDPSPVEKSIMEKLSRFNNANGRETR